MKCATSRLLTPGTFRVQDVIRLFDLLYKLPHPIQETKTANA